MQMKEKSIKSKQKEFESAVSIIQEETKELIITKRDYLENQSTRNNTEVGRLTDERVIVEKRVTHNEKQVELGQHQH